VHVLRAVTVLTQLCLEDFVAAGLGTKVKRLPNHCELTKQQNGSVGKAIVSGQKIESGIGNPSQSYRASFAMWDHSHTVLPATRHR